MAFQPFGDRFEISSPLLASDLKNAIRARKKRWFDVKTGARGWIVGPFICLWLSALNREGPMLFGRISEDGFGSRISGRAGSDLNGLAAYLLLMPVLAFLLFKIVTDGSGTVGQLFVLGGLILLTPYVLWWRHQHRKEAEPLVRFLRDVASPAKKASGKLAVRKELVLTVSGSEQEGPITPAIIRDTLMDMGTGDFVILHTAPEHYIQTAPQDGGFTIEKREDSEQNHFRGVRKSDDSDKIFSFEEAEAALVAYASDTAMPPALEWERMDMSDPSRW